MSRTAELLGLERSHLYRKMKARESRRRKIAGFTDVIVRHGVPRRIHSSR